MYPLNLPFQSPNCSFYSVQPDIHFLVVRQIKCFSIAKKWAFHYLIPNRVQLRLNKIQGKLELLLLHFIILALVVHLPLALNKLFFISRHKQFSLFMYSIYMDLLIHRNKSVAHFAQSAASYLQWPS